MTNLIIYSDLIRGVAVIITLIIFYKWIANRRRVSMLERRLRMVQEGSRAERDLQAKKIKALEHRVANALKSMQSTEDSLHIKIEEEEIQVLSTEGTFKIEGHALKQEEIISAQKKFLFEKICKAVEPFVAWDAREVSPKVWELKANLAVFKNKINEK